MTSASGQFFEAVAQGAVRWPDQPVLLPGLAEASVKTMGDAWAWNRVGSPVDIAPLCAVTYALWGLTNDVAKPKTVTAYGESYGRWW